MSTLHDDPRLTAYVLGEAHAADRAAVEQQIGESVETLLEIEAIREVAGQLRAALREESLGVASATSARSDSEGFAAQTQGRSFAENPLLALRTSVSPTLASITNDASPSRKASGKFAVTASCLALMGALGIVAVTGQHKQQNAANFAETSNRLEWYGFVAEGDGTSNTYVPLTAMSIVDAEAFGDVELKRRLAREAIGVDPTTARRGYFNSESAGGGLAPNSSFSGLGGLDVTALDSAPAVRGAGGIVRGGGTKGVGGGAGEGLGLRGSGSRQAMSTKSSGRTTSLIADGRATKKRDKNGEVAQGVGGLKGDVSLEEVSGVLILRGNQQDIKAVTDLIQELEKDAGLVNDETKKLAAQRVLAEYRQKQINARLEGLERLSRERDVVASAEDYAKLNDNPYFSPLQHPLSTFSIDVDTAAYSNMRRFLTQGTWPPPDSVRIEELVNYFSYDYTPPSVISDPKSQISNLKSQNDWPFAVHLEVAVCPWNAEHRLVRVGLKGKEIALDKRPVSNIVFLIDVSGSMQPANKLPLVKAGLRGLVEQFTENDRVGIVVYAGASGLVLDSTNATQKDVILSAIENLQAGGSTNGGEGIQLAYALARKNFINKGTNRVILCTDGDFNVGITNQDDLTRLIEEESKSGVFLSVLGFGMGNLKDSTLEKLADKGNGNYAYIDTLKEANKVFVEQMTGTLITIAKDVKIQIEFNPSQVGTYRLIGYENRLLAAQDFRDDTKDAGEIGAGHTVTALYEIIPPSKLPKAETPTAKSLKYQPNVPSPAAAPASDAAALRKYGPTTASTPAPLVAGNAKNELLTIWLRYKQPDADKSDAEIEKVLVDEGHSFAKASLDFRWAASVASFGMILRSSPHKGNATLDSVLELAQSALGPDKSGYREEFVSLVRSAKALQPHPTK